jgi:hypothetical protein
MKDQLKRGSLALAALLALSLAGCATEEAAVVDEGVGETYDSVALDTSYDGALSVSNQLALGTLQLEETELAVTPEQASELLPLWQALQQGGVTAEAEVNAVLAQIEGTMAEEQLAAIAAMALAQEDMQAWMEEQGLGGGGFGPGGGDPDLRATRRSGFGREMPGDGEIPPEMATRRAELGEMSEEEQESLRATMRAGGGFGGEGGGFPRGPGGRGGGRLVPVLWPLVELLEQRAGE